MLKGIWRWRSPSERRLADLDACITLYASADRDANSARMLGSCMDTCAQSKFVEERSFIFGHFPFCDAWQWIFLATSMCQQADPKCQWTAHACTESCRTTTCRLQGATIATPSKSGSQTKSKNSSTTVLLLSGVQQWWDDGEPLPYLAAQHACLSNWPMATCL